MEAAAVFTLVYVRLQTAKVRKRRMYAAESHLKFRLKLSGICYVITVLHEIIQIR